MGIKTYKPRNLRDAAPSFQPRKFDPERDKRQALYRDNTDWRDFAKRFLDVNRECYTCGKVATVVDHLVPHKGDRVWFEKDGNHLALCQTCHNIVTGKFDYKYRPGDSIEPKTKWMNEERARNEILQARNFNRPKVLKYREV